MWRVLLTLFLISLAFCEVEPEYIGVLSDGMFRIFDDDFSGAEYIFDSLSTIYPGDPTPKIFYIIAVASEMQDAEDYSRADELWKTMTEAESLCIAQWDETFRNPWLAFVYGTLLGYRAIFQHILERGNVISLWKDARKAADMFEIAVSDSIVGDEAANGLGNFYYWFSAKAGVLRSVGIVSDRREEGIALLKRAAEKSKISKDSALHSLVFILLDAGDTAGSIEAAEKLMERHPNSRTAMWDVLFVKFVTEKWSDVIKYVRPLYEYYDGKSDLNICQLGIVGAEAYLQLGDTTDACGYYTKIKNHCGNDDMRKKLKSRNLWGRYENIKEVCE
ncbi:tetratricopeptide repeat protein [bacterium]|nr:tetratricopeptide repeat protein [bacterium]